MNNGVELLLERMKTHPEEFSGLGKDGSKWYPLITSYRQHLAEELGDLQCMIDLLIGTGMITQEELNAAKEAKREKLKTWSNIK